MIQKHITAKRHFEDILIKDKQKLEIQGGSKQRLYINNYTVQPNLRGGNLLKKRYLEHQDHRLVEFMNQKFCVEIPLGEYTVQTMLVDVKVWTHFVGERMDTFCCLKNNERIGRKFQPQSGSWQK